MFAAYEDVCPPRSPADRYNNPAGSGLGYDAVNRYGDVSTTFGALNGQTVFMPGWSEREIIGSDSPAKLYRIIPSVHFLVTDKIKAMVEFKRADGTTSYQASNRYRLKNFATNQYRVELRSDRWFVRAYQTQDSGANSYDLPFTGAFMQTAADARSTSGRSYAERYFGAYAQAYNIFLGQNAGNVAVAGPLVPLRPRYSSRPARPSLMPCASRCAPTPR